MRPFIHETAGWNSKLGRWWSLFRQNVQLLGIGELHQQRCGHRLGKVEHPSAAHRGSVDTVVAAAGSNTR